MWLSSLLALVIERLYWQRHWLSLGTRRPPDTS
jgi:hypothetical protein